MNDPRIAPFPVTQLDKTRFLARWEDVTEAIYRLIPEAKEDAVLGIDIRTAGHWFTKLNVLWNGDTINAYVEYSEESLWVVEWDAL